MIEKKIASKMLYNGVIVNIRIDDVELIDGKRTKREVVEHPGGVVIIAMWENGEVAVVTQFRYAVGRDMIELPAGKLERGEDPAEAALRELKEETGIVPEQMDYLGAIYSSPGFCEECLHVFLARGLRQGEAQPDEGEFLEIDKMHIDVLTEKIANNEISDSKTIAGIFKAKKFIEK